MELVGKIVRKEIDGVGFCSGTVQSYDSSGYYKIVYENGVTETSKLAEFAALVMGEGKPDETPVQVEPGVRKRSRKRPREEVKRVSPGRYEETLRVNVMGNFDLNVAVPEEDSGFSDGFGVGLNCGPVDTLGIDLNRAVPEPEEGLGYEENCRCKRRRLIDLNLDASCYLDDAEVFDLNVDKRDGGFDLNVAVNVENSEDDILLLMNGDGDVQESNVQDENGVQDNLEIGGCEEVHVVDRDVQERNIQGENGVQDNLVIGGCEEVHVGDGDVQESNVQGENGVQDNLETGGCEEVHVAEVSSGHILEEIREQNSVSLEDLNAPDSNGAEGDHDLPEHVATTVDKSLSDGKIPDGNTSGRGKRGIGSGNSKHTSQARLRRSARIMLAGIPVSSNVTDCLTDEVSPSSSVNTLSAEENGIVDGNAESICVLPPKPQLPPSSPNLNLDGLPILYVFATYSFLRSFSTVLFLSPFELKDFVEALRCTSTSLLFDSIHVSVLQILRKCLEKLADEDDQTAILCLRSLDWDMLDMVNYPLYLVEYLLFSGSKDSPGVDLTRFNFFRNEYFKLPMNQKIEILSCLCGDMIAAEAVRSELNKRSVASVTSEMETDGKRAMMELASDFSSNDGVVDGSFDRNSDDCFICKMDGNLLCCDGCPAAYHSKCVGVACDLLPEGVWYCPECSFDWRVPGLKPGKQIRGSKFLEIDPHGRKYYSSCGYLLVVDTDGSVNYYHVNDVILVLEQLKSCGSFYIGVTSAIKKHLNIPVTAPLSAPEKQATSGVKKRLEETSRNGGSHLRCHRTRKKISGSATGPDILNMSSEGSAETAHNCLDVQSLHEPESSSILDVMKEVRPDAQSESGYRNLYIFAQMTTAISEEMARNSPDLTNDMRSDEDIASTQVKTILMKTTKFQWRNIQGFYLDAWKEKCGWCHSCKSKDAERETNCLFNMSLGDLRGPWETEIANSQPIDNKSHLTAIMWQILSMESRLQGLLVGPWLNPQHSRIWREHILNASSISSLRRFLVELEANLHHLALSPQWLNHVDSAVEMGSSRHVLLASTRSSSNTTNGERRGTLLESGVNPTAKKNVGLTMSWWRGGRLSRKLFNWKVLPRSLVSKAARQAGSVNIPGIMYPENSEPTKRSRRVAWKAAVESSTASEQLGFQVRTLYSCIKWDDIENSHLLLASDKDTKRSAGLFKKVIVRRKCIEEETVKYLLDFGKRRNIPAVVLKNGRRIEGSSTKRRNYWLNESYVPLHLLKGFEEREAVRKTSKPGGSFRYFEIDKVRKRSSEGKGFSYLFERAERSKSSLSEQYKKDVPLSDAACCHICKSLFHKKHTRRADKEGMYICLPCTNGVLAKEQPIVGTTGRPPVSLRKKIGAQTQKRKTVIPARKSPRLKAGRISIRLRKLKKVVASIPLRRSDRKRKQVIRLQDESQVPGGSKKRKLETKRGRGKPKNVREENSLRYTRRERCSSYWLNGLRLSRKPGDERVNKFWRDGCSKPLKNSDSDQVQRKCRLCGSMDSESGSTFIACETCEKWYHGDACGINEKNSSMVIGFRCHLCRELPPPLCPHM